MDVFAAATACVVLGALTVFQVALVSGAPWGRYAWGGQHSGVLPRPLRIGSAVSVALYVAMGTVLLDRAGVVDVMADGVSRVAVWVLVVFFVLGVGANAASRSSHERLVMVPANLVLAACALVVALR